MGNDNDGTRALDDFVTRCPVHGNDVLAAGGAAHVLEVVLAHVLGNEQPRGHDDQREAQQAHDLSTNARHEDSHHKQDHHEIGHQLAEGMRVELLNSGFEPMVLHDLDYFLGSLELLLTIRRRNANFVIEVVHVVACIGHVVHPLSKCAMSIHRLSIRQCFVSGPLVAVAAVYVLSFHLAKDDDFSQ